MFEVVSMSGTFLLVNIESSIHVIWGEITISQHEYTRKCEMAGITYSGVHKQPPVRL
jgi:hypothetical protein